MLSIFQAIFWGRIIYLDFPRDEKRRFKAQGNIISCIHQRDD